MRALTLSLSLLACSLGSTSSAQAIQFEEAGIAHQEMVLALS